MHCVDTEGPLHESVDATFERLRAIFHLELESSVDLLHRLQAGEVDLGGLEAAVQKVVDPHLLAYNDTWDKVDAMLAELMRESFRTRGSRFRRGGLDLQLVLRRSRRLRFESAPQGHGISQCL